MSEFFNFNQEDAVFNNLMSDNIQSDINVNDTLEANIQSANVPTIDPPAKASSFENAIRKSNDSLFNSLAAPEPTNIKGSAIKTIDPQNIEKFQAQDWYDPLNFNPYAYDTNMQKAIDRETWGSALAKGFDSFFYNATNTFTGWFSDYGKMADAVSNFDWDALKPTENELVRQYYNDQKNLNENFVFVPEEDEDGIFNKKFVSEFLGNVGYTYGTISALGIELAADVLVTGLSGGAGSGSFGATFAKLGTKLGLKTAAREAVEATAKAGLFRRVTAGYELADKSKDLISPIVRSTTQAEIAAAYRIPSATAKETFNSYLNLFSNNLLNISKSKGAYELAGNIMKGLPLLGTGIRYGENIAEAARAGAGIAELTGMGLKGLRRVSQELNMAISEASFESVSSYGDTLDGLVKGYQDSNGGELPDEQTFAEMRDYALKASSSNYDTNTAILLATNKLQFGNLFNRFVPANKALLAFQDTLVDKTVAQVAKRGAFKLYDKSGLFGTYGIIGKVAKDFGKKEAGKMIGKSMFRNLVQFEVTEGAQEILQEASASAWKNYYTNQFNKNTEYTLSDAFGEGFKEQYSKQGLKTFLMGALTGTLVKGPSKVLNNLVNKTQETYYNNKYGKDSADNPITQQRENLKKDIEAINAVFAKGGPGVFSSKLLNFNAQLNSTNEMTEAASKGMQYEFENGKDNALLSAIVSAYRTNTSKGFINAIRELGVDLTAEEFKTEFGIDIADTKYGTPAEFANSVADKLQKYGDTIDNIRNNAKNKFVDPYDYEANTIDRGVANYTRKAQEEAVYVLAMNAIKADMTADRLSKIENDLRNIPGLQNSSDYAMRVLTDPALLNNELALLETRLEQLENADTTGFTPDLKKGNKKQIKETQEEIKLLQNWNTLWKPRSEVTGVSTDKGFVFVGKEHNKKQRVKNADGKTIWEAQVTYDPKDKSVSDLFRKIVNLKNSQAGIDTLLTQIDLNQSFDKIADYIQLDKDTKDYLDAVEVLSEPSRFMEITKHSQEGLFKYNLELAIESLTRHYASFATNLATAITTDQKEAFSIAQSIFTKINDKVTNSVEYNALVAILTDPDTTLNNYKEAYTYINKLENIISLETYKIIKEYTPEEFKTDVTDQELDDALTNDNLSDFRELSIAEKVLNNIQLTPNEQKIYDDPKLKETIDQLVENLKESGYQSSVEIVENEDGTANVIDKETGEIINETPLSVAEAEDLQEKINNTLNQEPVAVEADKELDQKEKTPVALDEEFAAPSQSVEFEGTDSTMLPEFLKLTDSEKIKVLEAIRQDEVAFVELKKALGQGRITKEEYNTEVDLINASIFYPGAEELTLKALLDKNKLQENAKNNNVDTVPTTPAVTVEEIQPIVTTPTQPAPVSTDNKTAAYDSLVDNRISIDWNSVVYDPTFPGNKKNTSGSSNIIDYAGRKIVVINVEGRNVPFYLSTGSGGKVDVTSGKWYPIFGISNSGWFNKLSSKEINDYYGSEILKGISEALDRKIGDIRNDDTIPKVGIKGAHFDAINKDLDPIENETPFTRDVVEKNIKDTVDFLNNTKLATQQPSVSTDAKANAQTVKNRMQEIEKQPVYINVTTDASGKMEQTSEEVVSQIKAELDKIGLPYSDVVANDKGSTYFVVTKDGQQHEILKLSKTGNALVKPVLSKAKWINHLIKTQPQDLYDFVNAELAAVEGAKPAEATTSETAAPKLNLVIQNTPYEIINDEVFYNGQPIITDLKVAVDTSKMSPFDIIKIHTAQKEKEAKSKRTVLSKQLKDLLALQKEIDEESVEPQNEEAVDENLSVTQDRQIDEDREVVIDRIVEEQVSEEEIAEIAEEEGIAEDKVTEVITEAVNDVINNNKKGLFDKLGDKAKKVVKRILLAISGLVLSGFLVYSGPGQSLIKNAYLNIQENVTPQQEVNFTTSSFAVTPLEGCSAFVNNQVRSVIGKSGQEAINLFGDAWTSTHNVTNTGRGEYVFNVFNNYRKPNLKTSDEINKEIKRLVNKSSVITEAQLQEGDIINLFYENSASSVIAWKDGKSVYTSHVGIAKRNSDGKIVVEDNIHGIISQYTVDELNSGKISSVKGGKMRIAAVARPNYKLAGKTIKPYAPAKELSTSTTPIKKKAPLQSAGLFGIALLLRRKKDEGQDITNDLVKEIEKVKSEIEAVKTTLKDIKNNVKYLNDAQYFYEQNLKLPAAPVLSDKELALQETLLREMLKPNGKIITEFDVTEQELINLAPLALKQRIQKEEQDKADEQEKQNEDYKPFIEVREEDFDDNISELFATPEKIDNTKQNREYSAKYLGTDNESIIIDFVAQILQAVQDYNKANKTELVTVEDFVKFSKTKAIAADIKNKVFANEVTDAEEINTVLNDSDLDDNYKELFGENIEESTVESVTEVDTNNNTSIKTDFITSLVKDFEESKQKNSKNNAKFVKRDTIQSLLDDINDITNCL